MPRPPNASSKKRVELRGRVSSRLAVGLTL